MTDGWDEQTAWGYDHVVDDPTMGCAHPVAPTEAHPPPRSRDAPAPRPGSQSACPPARRPAAPPLGRWSRYCHGSRVGTKDAGFAFLQATAETVTLATRMARRLAGAPDQAALQLASNSTASSSLEKQFFNGELFFPSHGGYAQVGASVRILNFFCFPNSKGLLRYIRKVPDLQCAPHTAPPPSTPWPLSLALVCVLVWEKPCQARRRGVSRRRRLPRRSLPLALAAGAGRWR